MSLRFLRSCFRVFIVLPLCIFANLANCSQTREVNGISGVYAYVDTQGKLLISSKKSDSRYKRFDPSKRITPRIKSSYTHQLSPQISAQKITWTAQKLPSRWAAERAALLARRQAGSSWFNRVNIPTHQKAQHYASLINEIAAEVGVNPNLLHAIIQVESAYNPEATSPKGAQGLMQLIPATAERFGVEQSYEPADNVRGGARYIKKLLTLFNNDLQLAVAAYNAGEGAVQKYKNKIPPYPETQTYVNRVLSLFEQREE